MTNFIIVNKEEIPEDLAPGWYNTKVLSAEVIEGAFVFNLKFLNTPYDPNNPCLLPLIKHADNPILT